MIELRIYVEGDYDAAWVEMLVVRAFDRADLIVSARALGGKRSVFKEFDSIQNSHTEPSINQVFHIALVDADTPSVADAREEARQYFRRHGQNEEQISSHLFFAVPALEAWLFADLETAKRYFKRNHSSLNRITFPEEIPFPKDFALRVIGSRNSLPAVGLKICSEMDLDIAISRSPSLRDFLAGIGNIIGDDKFAGVPEAKNILGFRLLASLVRETNPSANVIYRTLAGERITAAQLSNEIVQGTPLARQYASDLLRVARDLLAREANDEGDE